MACHQTPAPTGHAVPRGGRVTVPLRPSLPGILRIATAFLAATTSLLADRLNLLQSLGVFAVVAVLVSASTVVIVA